MKGAMYGAKGSAFPVQPGQVWSVGLHLVACGDLEHGAGERLLEFGRWLMARPEHPPEWQLRPSLFYVDPPWSPSYITRFRRGADVVEDPAFTVESLCRLIFKLASAPLLMEMGTTYSAGQLFTWADVRPEWEVMRSVPITYAGGKPATLYGFGLSDDQGADLECLRNMDDERTPRMAMNLFTEPGDVVVDLCLGLGATARAAGTDRRCWGLELHPRRCSAALADLRKICGEEPSLIGTL